MSDVNIKDVVITMSAAQKRSLIEDRKKAVQLATQMQAATDMFNEHCKEVAESFADFGITASGLKTYAKAAAKSNVEGALAKLEAQIEELTFIGEGI
jgi:purine-nucleoside phosphorylase